VTGDDPNEAHEERGDVLLAGSLFGGGFRSNTGIGKKICSPGDLSDSGDLFPSLKRGEALASPLLF
jgi:hypothetical protein